MRRILGWPSPEPHGQRDPTGQQTPAGDDVHARTEEARPEVPDLAEFINAFDLDKERARLAGENSKLREENSRLWKELIDRNARLQEVRVEKERAARAQSLVVPVPQGALDREMELIGALLPNLEFLRDSREVVRSRLRNRLPVLSVLRDLSAGPGMVKGTRVQSVEGWLEQHFQTGEGPNGRIYFRCSGARCSVLVSFKVAQGADIRYLQGVRM